VGNVEFMVTGSPDGALCLLVRVDGSVVGHIRRGDDEWQYLRVIDDKVRSAQTLEDLLREVARRP
jgi:hypothetical protein